MNSSFVTIVYTEHFSSFNIIIILGTGLQLESMTEELSFMRFCDMLKFSRGGQTSGIGICLFATQITSVHLSLSDLLDPFVSAKHIQAKVSTFWTCISWSSDGGSTYKKSYITLWQDTIQILQKWDSMVRNDWSMLNPKMLEGHYRVQQTLWFPLSCLSFLPLPVSVDLYKVYLQWCFWKALCSTHFKHSPACPLALAVDGAFFRRWTSNTPVRWHDRSLMVFLQSR